MTESRKPARSARHWRIAGFALKANKFDGIYLGRLKGNELIYAGKVDNGLDKSSTAGLQARLKPLIRKTQPYAKRISHRGAERPRKRPSANGGRRLRRNHGVDFRLFGKPAFSNPAIRLVSLTETAS
jgi:hypothetical protein